MQVIDREKNLNYWNNKVKTKLLRDNTAQYLSPNTRRSCRENDSRRKTRRF